MRNVGRLTTPTFGLGLVDAMPDSFFDGLAAAEPAATRGRRQPRPDRRPESRAIPPSRVGATRVTRFGWKAGVPSLIQFSADAYVNEMGITTQSCFRGQALTAFAVESAPNGVPVSAELRRPRAEADRERTRAAASPPTQWAQVDDAVGACAGNRTEIQDDVFLFAVFMTSLAPAPARLLRPDLGDARPAAVHAGRLPQLPRHDDVPDACESGAGHHRRGGQRRASACRATSPSTRTRTSWSTTWGRWAIGSATRATAWRSTQRMRTAPLWGIRFRNHLLHDGRCGDIPCAVRAHDGQGAAARNAFNALSQREPAQHRAVRPLAVSKLAREPGGDARAGRTKPIRCGDRGRSGPKTSGLDRSRFFSSVPTRHILGRARRRCRGRPSSCPASGATGPAPAPRGP